MSARRRLREGLQLWRLYRTYCSVHRSPGKPDSMRVEYVGTGFRERVSEFIPFGCGGQAQMRAGIWWRMHGGELPVPGTVLEACARFQRGELRRVVELIVDPALDQTFPRVLGHRHEDGELDYGLLWRKQHPDQGAIES